MGVKSIRYLYVLVTKDKKTCKVGISVNPILRSESLKDDFDESESVTVSMPYNSAQTVEKFLHKVLESLAIKKDPAEGYTEWFHSDAKKKVISIVESFSDDLSIGKWKTLEAMRNDPDASKNIVTKTSPIGIRNTPDQEAILLAHAHIRGIKRRATAAQIIYDYGLEYLTAKAKAEGRWPESAEGLGWEK